MNWKNEAIEQLTKYDAMVEATRNIPEEIKRLEMMTTFYRSNSADAVRSGKTKGPLDDRIINNIVKRQQLEKSLKNAEAWVRTTDRAMSVLQPAEKKILEGMYIRPEKGAVSCLCECLGLEQSSVYRHRDTALYRFTVALYGVS